MRKIIICFLIVVSLCSCDLQFDCHYLYEEPYVLIASADTFMVNNIEVKHIRIILPIEIYNQNNFNIQIKCNNIMYDVCAVSAITIGGHLCQ